MPLYTPFFEKGMQKLGEGYGTMRRNQFVKDAYMGDEEALGNLYRVDPNAAMAIQKQQAEDLRIEEQRQRQTAADARADETMQMRREEFQQEQAQGKDATAVKADEFKREILKQATALPYDQAVPFLRNAVMASPYADRLAGQLPDFTEDAYERLKLVYAEEDDKTANQMQDNYDRYVAQLKAAGTATEDIPDIMEFSQTFGKPVPTLPSDIVTHNIVEKMGVEERIRFLRITKAEQWIDRGADYLNPISGQIIPKGLDPNETIPYLTEVGTLSNQQRLSFEEAFSLILNDRDQTQAANRSVIAIEEATRIGDITLETETEMLKRVSQSQIAQYQDEADIETDALRQRAYESGAIKLTTVNYEEKKKQAEMAWEGIRSSENFIAQAESGDMVFGSLGGAAGMVARFGASFGMDADLLTAQDLANQATAQQLAAYMESLGARGLTDRDMEILSATLATGASSKESAIAMSNAMIQIYQRKINAFTSAYNRIEDDYKGMFPVPDWFQERNLVENTDLTEFANSLPIAGED